MNESVNSISEEEKLFVQDLQMIINQTVETLSPRQSEIYKLSREKGLSNEDIASVLGLNKRTVENHFTAALSILRDRKSTRLNSSQITRSRMPSSA